MILRDYQAKGAAFLASRDRALLGDSMGLGKGQLSDDYVSTPNGFVQFGALKVNDLIHGSDGGVQRVTGVFRRGVLPVFRVTFSDGSFLRVDGDHLWAVTTPYRVHQGNGNALVLSTWELSASGLQASSGNAKFRIPLLSNPLDFYGKCGPVHPYVMGVLLGDGSLGKGTIIFTPGDTVVPEIVRVFLPAGFRLVSHEYQNRANTYSIVSDEPGKNEWRRYIKQCGLEGAKAESKFVPAEYLFTGHQERLLLLQGLMDTDGYAAKDCTQFSSASPLLVEAVTFLVHSLGGVVKRTLKPEPKYRYKGVLKTGLPSHTLTLSLPKGVNPFLAHAARFKHRTKYPPIRAIRSIEPDGEGEVICVSVSNPDHLYVTKDFIVTHNTAQAIKAFSSLQPRGGRVLIVCPASLRLNWAAEIKMWAPGTTVQIATNFVSMSVDVVIVSYNLLQSLYSKLRPEMWGVVICDEAHYMQSLDSQRTIGVRGGWGKSPIRCLRKWAMTGTPLQNRPINLYPILKWLEAPFATKEFFFAERFCGGEKMQNRGATNTEELNTLLKTIMLRRTKEEVLGELPPKIRQVIELDMGSSGEAARTEEVKIVQDWLGSDWSFEEVVQQLEKPDFNIGVMDKGVIARLRRNTGLAKIKASVEFIKDALESNDKIVVFAHHKDVIAQLCRHTEEFESVLLIGGMPDTEKQFSVEQFQKNPKVRLLFANIETGGTGHTLTASALVIFVEQDWTPGKNHQAEDRVHRLTQTRGVVIQYLVLNGSLDAHIARRNIEKQSVLDEVLA